jgi:hypothetical protein
VLQSELGVKQMWLRRVLVARERYVMPQEERTLGSMRDAMRRWLGGRTGGEERNDE